MNVKDENKLKTPNKIILFLILVFVIIAILLVYLSMDKNNNSYESTDMAMGTYVNQTVYGANAEETAKNAMNKINETERLLSWRIEDSDIAKINRAGGKDWVDVDKKTIEVLQKSVEVSQKSFGAFDLTILPISSLWDFDSGKNVVPSSEEINQRLTYVNYKNVKLNADVNRAKTLKEGCSIDLGAVAKGVACDNALEVYRKENTTCGIIAVGGSIGVYGTKPNRADWRIAIRDPYKQEQDSSGFAILEIDKGCVSTSGIYERHFNQDGVEYHHILDPKTGYPADNELLSVTIWHDSGIMTDILATACSVLGLENSSYILDYYDAGAVFVDKDKNVYVNSKLKDKIILTNEEYTVCDYE